MTLILCSLQRRTREWSIVVCL